MLRLAAPVALLLGVDADCHAPYGRHEGFPARLCGSPLAACKAPPHVTMNKFDYEQMQWQTCNGTVFTAAYDEDYGEGLQGDVQGDVYSSASALVKKAAQVSAGEDFGLVVEKCGKVMAYGSNEYGKLGIGDSSVDKVPDGAKVHLPPLEKASVVSAGDDHALFVTKHGHVYASGRNNNGQLCQRKRKTAESNVPLKVDVPGFVVDASAGYRHSLFLTRDGKVYACGNNAYGRLGIGVAPPDHGRGCGGRCRSRKKGPLFCRPPHPDDYETPQLVRAEDIVAIAAGEEHSLFLQRRGKVLAAGNNEEGELGLGEHVGFTGTPTDVGLDNVVAISAGGPNSLFLLKDGSVYGCGENDYFQVAIGNDDSVCTPTRAQVNDVVAIQTGEYGTMFMTMNGGTHFSGTYELTEVLFGPLDDDYYAPVPWQVHGFNWYSSVKDCLKDKFGKFLFKKYEEDQPSATSAEPQASLGSGALPLAAAACASCLTLLALAVRLRAWRASAADRDALSAEPSAGLMAVEASAEE